MQLKATIKADPSDDTPITVSITWSLREWRYALRQMRDGRSDSYEVQQVKQVIEAAIGTMDDHYGAALRADE